MKLLLILFLIGTQLYAQPSLFCPLDLNLGCNPDSIPKPDIQIPGIPGRCKIISKVHISDVQSSVGCEFTIKRIYILTNSCGQTITCLQNIRWKEDKIPPVIHCPRDTNLGCNPGPKDILVAAGGPFHFGLAPLAVDNCDGLIVAKFFKDSLTSNGCETMIFRTFIATDQCGNSAYCTQKITYVKDRKKPKIIKCPDTLKLGCNPDLSNGFPPPSEFPVFEDQCPVHINWFDGGDVTVTNCIASFTRLWLVTDICGNQSICEQKIIWTIDVLPPVIRSCPDSINYGCVRVAPQLPPPNPAEVVAIDNCGPVEILVLPDSIADNGCNHKVYRIYVARDGCGNKSRCIQVFCWKIISQPIVNVSFPLDLHLFCTMPILETDSVSGTCGVGYPVLIDIDTLGECPDNCTLLVTWRKYDCFGQYTEHHQTIEIECGLTDNLLSGKYELTNPVIWTKTSTRHWQFHLKTPANSGSIILVDLYGRTLFMKKISGDRQSVDIDLGWLGAGLYLFVWSDGKERNIQKILIPD